MPQLPHPQSLVPTKHAAGWARVRMHIVEHKKISCSNHDPCCSASMPGHTTLCYPGTMHHVRTFIEMEHM